MQCLSQYIPYAQTNKFSKIVLDYIGGVEPLRDFYEHPVNIEGIKSAIEERKKFNTNRKMLVEQLEIQYQNIIDGENVKSNIHSLLDENTFTICTAHQPNIFTGHLYFVYKILHAIKLAVSLKRQLPQYNFVPVFFMGSEDADLEELNHIVIEGEKYEWHTSQTGAVGRMLIDDDFLKLIEKISGRLSVESHGSKIIELVKNCFTKNATIEEATFLFVHHLFKEYGLVVLLPDNPAYKKEMLGIFEDDIFKHTSSKIVSDTSERLSLNYKAQAYPREINLFYLKDNIRNRIVESGDRFVVHDTSIIFSKEEIQKELREHPERFSPNVILRGMFQEIILPDVAWIGGGGELAYWLQLKDLFKNYSVPYPVLIVRNSLMIVDEKINSLLIKLKLDADDLFKGKEILFDEIVKGESPSVLSLDKQRMAFKEMYEQVKQLVKNIDITLETHTNALETRHMKSLVSLEKKMFRAEKRKFSEKGNQLEKIFTTLFPEDELQERTENFMLFYARWGKDFIKMLYDASLTLEQQFCIMSIK